MSYIRKKIIDGKEYFYEVESVREGDKVIQKHIRYVGANPNNVVPNTSPFKNYEKEMIIITQKSSDKNKEMQFSLYKNRNRIEQTPIAIGSSEKVESKEPKKGIYGGFHTHVNAPPIPSAEDIAHAIKSNYKEFSIGGLALRYDKNKIGPQKIGWGKGGKPVIKIYKLNDNKSFQKDWLKRYNENSEIADPDEIDKKYGKPLYKLINTFE